MKLKRNEPLLNVTFFYKVLFRFIVVDLVKMMYFEISFVDTLSMLFKFLSIGNVYNKTKNKRT